MLFSESSSLTGASCGDDMFECISDRGTTLVFIETPVDEPSMLLTANVSCEMASEMCLGSPDVSPEASAAYDLSIKRSADCATSKLVMLFWDWLNWLGGWEELGGVEDRIVFLELRSSSRWFWREEKPALFKVEEDDVTDEDDAVLSLLFFMNIVMCLVC